MGNRLQKLRNKRFRINPVEWMLFGLMSCAFGYSGYQLIYQDSILTHPLAAAHYQSLEGSRSPASVNHPLLNLDLKCEPVPEEPTQAGKVRLSGAICQKVADDENPSKTSVVNSANRYTATVFIDTTTHKFSTDYIPLNSGKNLIHLEFAFSGGKVDSRDIVVTKN